MTTPDKIRFEGGGIGRFLLGAGLMFSAMSLPAQTPAQTTSDSDEIHRAQQQKIDRLEQELETIQQELMELKKTNLAETEPHTNTTVKATAPPESHAETAPEVTNPSGPHSEPFAFADFTWLNGNPRTRRRRTGRSSSRLRFAPMSTTLTTSAIRRTTPSADRARSSAPMKCRYAAWRRRRLSLR